MDWKKQFKEIFKPTFTKEYQGSEMLVVPYEEIVHYIDHLLQQKDQEWRDKIEKWANTILEDKDISNGRYNAMNDLIKFIKQ